ncbi:MAG TPA: ANTAR domain-containing protein [Actinomycetota bacterium]|nr:ANTAR domain-containing protein [Actinomycetota bacterium]
MTEADAFRHIQKRAMNERRSMKEIAQEELEEASADKA